MQSISVSLEDDRVDLICYEVHFSLIFAKEVLDLFLLVVEVTVGDAEVAEHSVLLRPYTDF